MAAREVQEPVQEPEAVPQHTIYNPPEEGTGAGAPEVNASEEGNYVMLETPGGDKTTLAEGFGTVAEGQDCECVVTPMDDFSAQMAEMEAQIAAMEAQAPQQPEDTVALSTMG